MPDLIPTSEVARRYGVIERRVRQIAQSRGIEPAATRCPCCGSRGHYWTPAQVAALKPGKPGRPPAGV